MSASRGYLEYIAGFIFRAMGCRLPHFSMLEMKCKRCFKYNMRDNSNSSLTIKWYSLNNSARL